MTRSSKRVISWCSAVNYAFCSACSSASIVSACSMYARMDATSGPLFTVLFYTDSAKFSTWTVEGIAWRRALRSGGWFAACWRVDGSGWVVCTASNVGSCAGWATGMMVRVVS
jgi:hypothetical protein